MRRILSLVALLLILSGYSFAQVKAFPSAEGFGKNSLGGRGGKVYEVTNLNDSGPGSLRECVQAVGTRTCVFRTGGTITLNTGLTINSPFLTIAGQTAPGGGICLRNASSNTGQAIFITTHDVTVRHLRVRPGPATVVSSGLRCIMVSTGAHNVIIDHCSASWSLDQNINTFYNAHDVTYQWCFVTEPLDCSTHDKGCHSKGALIGDEGSSRITLHHNLIAHSDDRNPKLKVQGVGEAVNNVVYNWGRFALQYASEFGPQQANLIGNYFKTGPSYKTNAENEGYEVYWLPGGSSFPTSVYLSGNIGPHRTSDSDPQDIILHPTQRTIDASTPYTSGGVTATSAAQAYTDVLANGGATKPSRDSVDARIVTEVQDGTGKIIDDPSEVGGWPSLSAGTPLTDTDHDGMPDSWESSHGLNPNSASDGAQTSGNGYTNLENYLNDLAGDGAPASLVLQITSSFLPNGSVGQAYSSQLSALAGTSPYTWSVQSGSLPAGLSLNASSGAITGTPTTAATSNFIIRVTDDVSATTPKALSITIGTAIVPVQITTSSLPGGSQGVAYSSQLQATGGTPAYTWAITSGSLPSSLSLNTSSGTISGTPTSIGTSSFTARVTDSASATNSKSFSLTIAGSGSGVQISTGSLPGGTQGTAYSQSVTASGGTTPYTWSVISGSLPGGLSQNSSSGTISGTPSAAGTFNFAVKVTDSLSLSATRSFTVIIATSGTDTFYVSKSGNNSNSCSAAQNPATAKLTIQDGIDCLSSGDTLLVKAGTYVQGNLTNIPSGASWSNLTRISVYPGDFATITSDTIVDAGFLFDSASYVEVSGLKIDGRGDKINFAVYINGGHHIRLKDLEITNTSQSGIGALGWDSASGARFCEYINLHVHNCGDDTFDHGIYIDEDNNLIDGGQWHDNAGHGINIYQSPAHGGSPSNNIVRNIKAYNNSIGIGIYVGSGNLAYNNLSYLNTSSGFRVTGAGAKISNNTIFGNQVDGVQVLTGSAHLVKNNIIYQNGTTPILDQASGTVKTNNLTTDPKFINAAAGDFRLLSTSSAIDAGATLAEVTDDADGNSRPQGVAYDIGAYESGGSGLTLTITSLLFSPTNRGVQYSSLLTASGGTAPYSWQIAGGSLPPGLVLSSTQSKISGLPTSVGTYNFTIVVSDSLGVPAYKTVTLIVLSSFTCDWTIPLGTTIADARTNYSGVGPGDNVCITSGTRPRLVLNNFQGTSSAPITFVNSGGQAVISGGSYSFGIYVQNCRYVNITGSGSTSFPYGIKISGSSYTQGMHVTARTSDIELDHIEVSGPSAQGIQVHTTSDCPGTASYDYNNDGQINTSDSTTEPNFTQYNTVLHDNYIHDTGSEGFYLGNNPNTPISGCGSSPAHPRMSGLLVYANRIERSGWDSINIKAMKSPYGCLVYGNTIIGDSQLNGAGGNTAGQQGGINADDESNCDIYRNLIKDGHGNAIKLGGTAGRAFNNIIINPGQGFTSTDDKSAGINSSRGTSGQTLSIWNNTIINPKGQGIRFNFTPGSGLIQNNIIINPGAGSTSYVVKCGSCTATINHNYQTMTISDALFRSASGGDYGLLFGSPAIDMGVDLSVQEVLTDYVLNTRPSGTAYDAGAYEFCATQAQARLMPRALRAYASSGCVAPAPPDNPMPAENLRISLLDDFRNLFRRMAF